MRHSAARRFHPHAFLSLSGFLAVVLSACGGTPTSPSYPFPQYEEVSFKSAARITADAGIDVLGRIRPGLFERDVKGMIDAVYAREGGGPPSFPHIVGSGPNALIIHYEGDDRQLAEGDLVLIDIGATFDGHSADMSRTFPVSGRFTERQREIYQLVLDAQRAVVTRLRPGVDALSSTQAWARDVFRASPLRARDANGAERTLDVFLLHSVYHYVGRDVHGADTGWSTKSPLQPHQVFTMEPGLYIASEGIGIRIEDSYLVTERGVECLTCACPKEVADVEARQRAGARPR